MTTEAEAISALARKSITATTVKTADGREFIVAPNEVSVRDVSDEHSLNLKPPRYIKLAVALQTQDSLIEYVNRFKSDQTTLMADIANNSIVAVLDYHGRDNPAMMAHRATLSLPFSEEWRLWSEISGRLQPQLEFARFIEENAADVRAPDAGELLEAVRDLQAHRKVNFIKAVRTSSENENFEYQDETKATTRGGIELPTKFKLGIPVYFGEPDVEVFAFLRWKINTDEGGLHLGIALHRAEHVRQSVFQQIVTAASEKTACQAIFGKL